MGAVIANAIYDASKARLRQFPMTPQRIQAALRNGG
jgi:CO/xanthine dehydrogenase Mo-binding subunit